MYNFIHSCMHVHCIYAQVPFLHSHITYLWACLPVVLPEPLLNSANEFRRTSTTSTSTSSSMACLSPASLLPSFCFCCVILSAYLGGEVEGERKKGLGNTCIPSYGPYLHLPQVAMVTRLRNTIMNIDKQVLLT